MASLLLVTEDHGFATAAEALSSADLTVTRAHAEEAVAVARHDLPDVLAIDTDSIVEAKPLIATLSLVTRSIVVAVARQAWPGSEAADLWRQAGADAVLPKPSGVASRAPTARPTRNGSRIWFAPQGKTSREQWCRFAADGAIQRRGRPALGGDRARPRQGRARGIDAFGHRSAVPGIPFDQGLARVVAADGMERLTHEAESLLSPVRSGDRSFDTTIQEPLIAATDALRDALAEPLGWQAPIKIIEALRAATAAIGPDGSSENTSDEAGNEPWRFLGDDLDLLRAFAELLDEVLPAAAQAIVRRDEDGLREAIDAVTFACTRLGFDGVGLVAQCVAVQTGAERVCAFAGLMRKAARFGALVGEDCGVTDAAVVLHDVLRATLATCLDEALAAQPHARQARLRRCIPLCDVAASNSGAGRLIEDIVEDLPRTVGHPRDRDALLLEGIAVLRRGLDSEREADVPVATFRDAICAPYRAGEEIEAHLRRLGLDTRLFALGPPRWLERLSTLLDRSGATLKEVFVEAVTPASLASLARLDPLLGQSAMRGGRPGIAVLLLDADPPGAVAETAADGVGELRRLDPGHVPGEFSVSSGSGTGGAERAGETQVRVPVAVLDKLFGRVGEFFSIGSRLNVLATETDVPDALRR